MAHRTKQSEREKAWSATKLAIRRYSRDPSQVNAKEVEWACRRLRNLPALEGRAAPAKAGASPAAERSR